MLPKHFWCGAVVLNAAVVFDAEDRGGVDEHFGRRIDFDFAQAAGFQKGQPALIGGEEVFSGGLRAGADRHGKLRHGTG